MTANQFIGDNYELNENSNGDLEIVDSNNGQTVLTHDNSTQTWQFGVDTNLANNDLTGVGALDAQSVSTEQVAIKSISADPNNPTFLVNSDSTLISSVSKQITADNTEQNLISLTESGIAINGTAKVWGQLSGGSDFFVDTIDIGGNRISEIRKTPIRGSPAPRSYSRPSTGILGVTVDAGGASYDVRAHIIGSTISP